MTQFIEEKFADCEQIRERIRDLRTGPDVIASPRISVVIPAFEIASFVGDTLESVFAQTYKEFEVIVVNDGSTDTEQLEAALEPFFDRIVYARQDNFGASRARNLAICLSRGEILAFLDGDDLWKPEFLESQLRFLDSRKLDMTYCDAELFGEELFDGDLYSWTSPSTGEVNTISLILATCNVITSGTMLRKDALRRVDLFDVTLPQMQDFDLWYRLAKNGAKIGYQTEVLVKYRVRINSLSGNNVERSYRNIRALNVIREKYGLSDAEKIAWESQMLIYEAEYELEQGKFSLTRGDFKEAHLHIVKANQYFRKPKLYLLSFMVSVAPKLALRLFKKLRPAEYSFIAPQ